MEHVHSTDAVNITNFASRMVNPMPLAKVGKGGFKDFKEFALKGSVLDMAIGIILGVAFGKIISSFVEDIVMPVISRIFGKMDFSNMFVSMTGRHFDTLAAAKATGAHAELRRVHERHIELCHRGCGRLSSGATGKPLPQSPDSGHEGVPILFQRNHQEGDTVSLLHVGTGGSQAVSRCT